MTQPRMLLGGAALALLLGGAGVFQWYRNAAPPPVPVVVTHPALPDPRSATSITPPSQTSAPPAPVPAPASAPPAAGTKAPASPPADMIMVDVVGAVKKPGVYRLPPKARLADAVHAAGGARAGADMEAVNLASFAQDGEQIRVPTLAERRALQAASAPRRAAPRLSRPALAPRPIRTTAHYSLAAPVSPAPGASPHASVSETAAQTDGIVNINTATAEELDSLPGVGPTTAAAILAYRQAHGPFQRVDDLLEVRGIGPKKLERMRDRVAVR
jgi:competence protein ComEA